MITLYDYLDSGNGYRVRLLLSQLAIPYRYVELDTMQGESRSAQFLAKNSNGNVPVLELQRYPGVRNWMAREASQPGYVRLL